MFMGETKEAVAILSNHYRSYEMLMAKAHMEEDHSELIKLHGLLVTVADQFAGVSDLTTYAEVHNAVNALN